jgi:hypothetical protein
MERNKIVCKINPWQKGFEYFGFIPLNSVHVLIFGILFSIRVYLRLSVVALSFENGADHPR